MQLRVEGGFAKKRGRDDRAKRQNRKKNIAEGGYFIPCQSDNRKLVKIGNRRTATIQKVMN
ncbi:MAG: hypothetical protein LBM08_01945 [Dysgonamonadaceae bacterium]|nr:hypothetical protein [Dysgonamonadaceae bacterium]